MAPNHTNRRTAWLAIWLFLATSIAGAAEPKRLVFIIFDSSPGTRYVRKEMLAVAEGTLAELKPGDRLWVIAGHPSRGRLLLVGTTSPSHQLIREAKEKLKGIKTKLFWPSDLAAALAAPLEALRQDKAGPQRRVLIIVITDGRLSETRTRKLLSATEKAKAAGAEVIVTGVKDTSPGLLTAAAEDRIQWTLLSKCDPSTWLTRATQNGEDGKEGHGISASSDRQEPGERVLVDNSKNNWFVFPQDRWDSSGPSLSEPDTLFSDGQKGSATAHPSLSVEPKSPAPKLVEPATTTENAERQTPGTQDSSEGEDEARSPSLLALFLREVLSSGWLLAGLILLAVLSVPAMLLARDYARSARQKSARQPVGLKRGLRVRALAAVVNGLEHTLGREDSLRRVRIGRDPGNSIVLNSKDVERNHVELTRKNGTWHLRNLSDKPIEVNSVTVPGRGKHPVFFPAVIKLSPKSTVRLLLRPHVARDAGDAAPSSASDDRPQQRVAQPATA